MIGKKINQLATELAPVSTDLTIIGDPISGVSKKITLAQLGAIFSGAVSFYTNLAGFPATGDINVIYCAKDTQKLYLWSGSAYVEVFPSQALLDTYQLRSEKGVSNGYASLDSTGKVPISQLPSSIMEYKGTWNAATNTPTLANGTGDTGDVYICNVAGTVNFGAGAITFAVGDYVIYSGSIWQRSSGAVGTVTSVAASITGNAIGITGSPVTTSGTLALAFAGTSGQYINGAGNLTTFPTLTGFVPYTGATANVDLGTFDLTADILTAATGSYTSSGGGNTLEISHTSGSGIALNITKGGNGEGLYINKTSGTGNAATIIGTLNATTLVKSGGTSTQFLKADGSVDSSTYLTTSAAATTYLPMVLSSTANSIEINGQFFDVASAANSYTSGRLIIAPTYGAIGYQNAGVFDGLKILTNGNAEFSNSGITRFFNQVRFDSTLTNGTYTYTLPGATGTLALTSDLTGGTVTSVGLSSATSGVTIGSSPVTTSGTITLAIATASGSQQGLLSSTDWTTFNNKQNALTNPVTGTGTTNYLPKFTGTSTIGNSIVQDSGSAITIGGAVNVTNANINLSNAYYLSARNNANTTNISLIGRNTSDRVIIDADGYGTTIGGGGSVIINPTGGDLLIGTTTPLLSSTGRGNITINGSSSSILAFGIASALSGYIYSSSSNLELDAGGARFMQFNTNGNERMRISASGNLSIGNTNDTYKLDVSGASRILASTYTAGAILYLRDAAATGSNTTFGGLFLGSSPGTDFVLGKQSTNAVGSFAIKTGGGTTLFTLADTGAATFSSSAENVITWSRTSSKNWSLSSDSAGGYFKNTTDSVIPIYMTNAGNVGIGTTSPSELLDVRNSYREPTSGEFTQILSSTTTQDAGRGGSLGFGGFTNGTSGYTTFSGIKGFKENGDGGNTAGALAFYTRVNGGAINERMRIKSNGIINLSNVPSSSAGLSSGDVYKTVAGVLMIV